MLYILMIIPIMLIILLLKAFFSGSEIALVSADKIKLSHKAKQGDRGAQLVLELFRQPDKLLTTTLVGTNFATVTLTTIGTLLMIKLFGREYGDVYAFVLYTPLFLILDEIVPKSIFQQKANDIARYVVYPLRFFYILFFPIVFVFSGMARYAARLGGKGFISQHLFIIRDQLRTVMDMAERASDIEVFDRFRIERALRFADTTVGEEMIPMAEMATMEINQSIQDAVGLIKRIGFNRLPVYSKNVSNIIGVVTLSTWDLLDPDITSRTLQELSGPPHYVSPYESIAELLPFLRDRRDQMAIVVDEFGSAIGMITMEDIIEAVVGEIEVGYEFEEYFPLRTRKYEVIEDGIYLMDGRLPISEMNDVLGLFLPGKEFHTVGGMMMSKLRHLAKEGESIIDSGYRFTVEVADDRTVKKVRVEKYTSSS